MALPIWQRTITTEAGDVIPGAEVEVVNEATGLAADIFSNRSGTTSRTNPFFTGADGFAQFYVAPGEYRITATGPTGSITWRWNVLTGDAALMANNSGASSLGTLAAQNANSVNISGGAISSTNVTGGTVNATTLQQGGSQAYVRSNILGTVSESGGIPTGAIIERGSNANGEFVKYADGTFIQQVFNFDSGLIQSDVQDQFDRSNTWFFPGGAFTSPLGYVVYAQAKSNATTGSFARNHMHVFEGGRWADDVSSNRDSSFISFFIYMPLSAANMTTNDTSEILVRATAIGRWY